MSVDERSSWDEVWMDTAVRLGQRSRCTRGKIGCVIVSSDNRVVAASYVGPPPRFAPANYPDDRTMCTAWCTRSQPGHEPEAGYEDCVSSHAEMNAIARSDYSMMQDGTAYVNGTCCIMCCKALAAAGVRRVVMKVLEGDEHRQPDRSIQFLHANSIRVDVIRGQA